MQFHLNGFRTGDPSIAKVEGEHAPAEPGSLPDEVDVLIVGCGPAGLTLAAQLAAFPDIKTRIVEEKAGPLTLGQADGIACRTMEMFEAFEFSEKVLKEAYWVNEITFWKPDDQRRERITRQGRIQDTEDGLSEFPHVILNQARVHDFFLETMSKAASRLSPCYSRRLSDLTFEGRGVEGQRRVSGYPVTVRLEHRAPGFEGSFETVRARFVVGCDGARSSVRKALNLALHGDSANQAWGVMDVLAVTDFPDIRLKATIHSAESGSILIIPREGGYLVRFYIELDKLNENERVSSRNITVDALIAAAQRILRPYVLEVKEVAWWSVYEIGQRLCNRFDNAEDEGETRLVPNVFIAGDACHTHSPKAGQGMNVSMQDAFNLGWKLASVIRKQSRPEILQTYSDERQAVAKELIDFDRIFAKMFSAPPKDPDNPNSEGVDPAEFQRYFVKQGRFTAGTATRYKPSLISAPPVHQHLAEGLQVGMRFHSAPVVRLADARSMQLGHTARADGRWRMFIFSDQANPADLSSRLRSLCAFLAESPTSPIRKYTPDGSDVDSIIDVRAVLQQGHREVDVADLPSFLLPQKGRYGLIDYEKVFCPHPKNGEDVFTMRGINREEGCLVLVRPDQYIAHILPLDAHAGIAAFFDGFMLDCRASASA
jgi:phenol 2-monooxygenase